MRLACIAVAIVVQTCVLMSVNAFASSCGMWERNERGSEFAGEPFGTLGFARGGRYFVLPRERCVNITDAAGRLSFAINHNGSADAQPTFASIHVGLVKIGGVDPQQQYLFRNGGNWARDKSGLAYSSTHPAPHSEFDNNLQRTQREFDGIYHDDVGRTWNDAVDTDTTPALRFESWNYRTTFTTKAELLEAVARKQITLKSQNYLIAFRSRPAAETNAAGSLPTFTFDGTGYDCAFIRVSGTSSQPEMAGEYMINLKRNKACDDVIAGFTALVSLFDLFH